MNPERDRASPRRERALTKAICEFPGGETRVLYVTRLALDYAYIRSFQPPALGTAVSVIIQPYGAEVLPPISARVVSTLLDPRDPTGCGFSVVFASMSTKALEALTETLERLGLPSSPPPGPIGERRVQPRVWMDVAIAARIEVPSGVRTARVANLSLGGALLAFGENEDLTEFAPGTTVPLDIVLEYVPEVLSVQATVVRRTEPGEPYGVGVRFVDLESAARARVEGILLYVLGEIYEGYRIPR